MLHAQSRAINHVMGGCLYAPQSPRHRLCTQRSWQHLSERLLLLGDSETAVSDHVVLCSLCLGTSGWDLQPLESLEIPLGGWNASPFLNCGGAGALPTCRGSTSSWKREQSQWGRHFFIKSQMDCARGYSPWNTVSAIKNNYVDHVAPWKSANDCAPSEKSWTQRSTLAVLMVI